MIFYFLLHWLWLCSSCSKVRGTITVVIIWLAPWAGKMNQIGRCDWLPERARWSNLALSRLLAAVSREKNFPESQIINPLLIKLFRSRWLDIGLIYFLWVYGPQLRLHKYLADTQPSWPHAWSITHISNSNIISSLLDSALYTLLAWELSSYPLQTCWLVCITDVFELVVTLTF